MPEVILQHVAESAAETATAIQSLSLVDVMIENLQLKIHNVHFRVEDATSFSTPFAFGIHLSNLCMTTTNELWNPTFVYCFASVSLSHSCSGTFNSSKQLRTK